MKQAFLRKSLLRIKCINRYRSLSIAPLVFLSSISNAVRLEIIHTNDLHTYYDQAADSNRGGYAWVKKKLDALSEDARRRGVASIRLDAGDFLEGNIGYYSRNARDTYLAMNAMGFDAVAVGNHDWFMGVPELNELVKFAPPTYALLAANFGVSTKQTPDLAKTIRPYVELEVSGLKVAILGLTTNELFYRWTSKGAGFSDPVRTARAFLPTLLARNDAVIALTHIGVSKDQSLVKGTKGLAAVIGGHSHTLLSSVLWAKDQTNTQVPIVQVGKHGENVGRLVLEIDTTRKKSRVLSYDVLPVRKNEIGEGDSALLAFRDRINDGLNERFGEAQLNRVAGTIEGPIENINSNSNSVFGRMTAVALRRAAGADIGVDVGQFQGVKQPGGDVTRRKIMQFYPHVFEVKERNGFDIYTFRMRGIFIKIILSFVAKWGYTLGIDGVSYQLGLSSDGNLEAQNIMIQNAPIQIFKNYLVAAPEPIVRGAFGISRLFGIVMRGARDSGVSIWDAIEAEVRRRGQMFLPEVEPLAFVGPKIERKPFDVLTLSQDEFPVLEAELQKEIDAHPEWLGAEGEFH